MVDPVVSASAVSASAVSSSAWSDVWSKKVRGTHALDVDRRVVERKGLWWSRVLAVCDGRRSHEVDGLVMMVVKCCGRIAGPNDDLVLEFDAGLLVGV